MLAYSKTRLDSWFNRRMTEEAADLGLISETEKRAILNSIPSPFFSPRTIVRIGLGFATMVAVSMCLSFVQLVVGFDRGDFIISFIFGAAVIFLLENMIRKKKHFRSGIDDMLLYQGVSIIIGGFISIYEKAPDPSIAITSIATSLALLASLRYADRVMSAMALLAFTAFTYFVIKKISDDLWLYMPVIVIAYSFASWITASNLERRNHLVYYRHCFEFLQLLCLVLAGIATNYYVVAEGWYYIHQQQIGGAWKELYTVTTVVVPLATIISGFLQKDKKRIRIGALMVAGAVMTFHHYVTDTPVETLCIIYGALLLIVSYGLIKYYRSRENGVSFSEKHDGRDIFDIESLLIGAGVGMITPQQAPDRFGGGDFGGAGSGGKF
jgi:hypothetical protein